MFVISYTYLYTNKYKFLLLPILVCVFSCFWCLGVVPVDALGLRPFRGTLTPKQ